MSVVEKFKTDNGGKLPVVMIVDDEVDLCELLKSELGRQGLDVVTASSGDRAVVLLQDIQKSEDKACPLVITDVRMPGQLDGPGWIKKAQELGIAPAHFAFMSGYTDLTTEQAYHLGACQILKKPFSLQEATGLTSSVLEGRFQNRAQQPSDAPKDIKIPSSPLKPSHLSAGRYGFFCGSEILPKIGQWAPFHLEFSSLAKPVKGLAKVRWLRTQDNNEGPRGFGAEIIWLEPDSVGSWTEHQTSNNPKSYIPIK